MDFKDPTLSTVKFKVNLNAAGNIAQAGETVESQKYVAIPGFKHDIDGDDAKNSFDILIGTLCGGSYDTVSGLRTVSVTMDEEGE